jgi:hypothetical protein
MKDIAQTNQTWTEKAFPAGSIVAVRWHNRRVIGTVQADNGSNYIPIRFYDEHFKKWIEWSFHPHEDDPALVKHRPT